MRPVALARNLVSALLVLGIAKSASAAWNLAAWGVALAIVGIVSSVAVILATDDGSPEIGAIRIVVDDSPASDWYVGQQRLVRVDADVSFGHIRGSDVGVITLEADFDGDVEYRETRRYTEQADGDSETETLGRWEGTIQFAFAVEATGHGIGSVGVKITVDGEDDGLIWDSPITVTDNESEVVQILYPLETQGGSGAIGWLNPAQDTIFHVQCFDQGLEVRNRATVHGQVESGRIASSTATGVPFAKANNDAAAVTTEIVEGPVGHDSSLVHANSVGFKTDWTLQGTNNVRLFLDSESSWSDDGGAGPSSQDNTCDGGIGNCTLLNTTLSPVVRDVDETFVLEILSRNEPPRSAQSREVLVTDTSGLSKTRTTNGSGTFTITEPALGPRVGLNLVTGSDAALFEPKLLTGVNVELFDSDSGPTFDSFSIMEAEAPAIQGSAVDGLGNPVRTDLFVVDPEGIETFLGRFPGPISIPGGLDLSTLGYPDTTFRMKPLPEFNRAYQVPHLDFVVGTAGDLIDLGAPVFFEREPYAGPVVFRGRFEIRQANGISAEPAAGYTLHIEGFGTVVTDGAGEFEATVMSSPQPLSVLLEESPGLSQANGELWPDAEQNSLEIEFGRAGPVLDLGLVTLHAKVGPVEVPLLGTPALFGLIGMVCGAGAVWLHWRPLGRAARSRRHA